MSEVSLKVAKSRFVNGFKNLPTQGRMVSKGKDEA
jgi:hypothetical protein